MSIKAFGRKILECIAHLFRHYDKLRQNACVLNLIISAFLFLVLQGGHISLASEKPPSKFLKVSKTSATPPPVALKAGYLTNTFSAPFNLHTVNLSVTPESGFSWYLWGFFGSYANPRNVVLNDDDTITLLGDTTGPNGQIATIAPTNKKEKFIGNAFGGGAYIEATLRFDPQKVLSSKSKGWPSFWAMSSEHLVQLNEQWTGRPKGYLHFIEVDILEYDVVKKGEPFNHYGIKLHDWYGEYHKTCPDMPFCQASLPFSKVKVKVPVNTNFDEYHRYGFLWLPATPDKKGMGRFYFDGIQIGEDIAWEMFVNQRGVPHQQLWKFGIIDKHHLVLILGTGPNQQLTVRSVHVWQASDAQNLHY